MSVVNETNLDPDLPEPGPPFRIGERVIFAPIVFGPISDYLNDDENELEILEVDHEGGSFAYREIADPDGRRFAYGMDEVVRVTPNYVAWRAAWVDVYTRTCNEQTASRETENLWLRVLAEHPIHGHDLRNGTLHEGFRQ
jgi:hypothetical protein